MFYKPEICHQSCFRDASNDLRSRLDSEARRTADRCFLCRIWRSSWTVLEITASSCSLWAPSCPSCRSSKPGSFSRLFGRFLRG